MNNDTIAIVLAVVLIGFGLLRRRLFGSNPIATGSRLKDEIENGALVVDVRSPEEFAAGHYSGAKNIPLDQIGERAEELGAVDTPVVLYCASGNRSAQAIAVLHRKGFRRLINGGGLHNMP